ncbi:glycosyltransferase family 9 protein [Aequorivita echinoideorum]|uniref:Glycosyltransferase family 9 protein n=1 Tax=Aequorivita echinoideorum TaxID=1549647 RepID=A0ABS5S1X1_9FLAO|nr:glycosyltransferase family 9 protein [Aequorivita echinoideorum]MBT0607179.1 glycosyltransferase family 9 protein [Aequorivita echinoideorum]
MQKIKHISVIRLSAMGDVAMIVPMLTILAKTYPDLKITMVSRPFFKPFFEGIENVQFLEADVKVRHKRFGLLKLANEIHHLGVDAVADLHGVIRSKIITEYLKLKGLKTASIDKGRREKKALVSSENKKFVQLKSTHQRYAEVFAKLGFPINLKQPVFLMKKRLTPKLNAMLGVEMKKAVGIAPFAAHQSKMYPLDMMAKVVAQLDASDKYQVFLFGGGNKEGEILKKMAAPFGNVINVAGKFSFEEELVLISNLDVMVSMDSGNGHLAAMYGVPVLTIWGVTHPFAGFTPFNQPMENQLVADRQAFPKIPTSVYGNKFPAGYEKAAGSISVEAVVAKIKNLLY